MADEIMSELWEIKDDIAREHHYDLDALVADLRARRREETKKIIHIVPVAESCDPINNSRERS